ncbi:hypothetical protein J437_LFUL014862 [Ladona fulva]|uniref:Uncharacterized protein n=1 Tax=Ladona fulva TaxID=123851 RepID=A0A8K0KNS5_LADFU|nr:hypothetical protein J437_LFUL014862 [Ladona fulva]
MSDYQNQICTIDLSSASFISRLPPVPPVPPPGTSRLPPERFEVGTALPPEAPAAVTPPPPPPTPPLPTPPPEDCSAWW